MDQPGRSPPPAPNCSALRCPVRWCPTGGIGVSQQRWAASRTAPPMSGGSQPLNPQGGRKPVLLLFTFSSFSHSGECLRMLNLYQEPTRPTPVQMWGDTSAHLSHGLRSALTSYPPTYGLPLRDNESEEQFLPYDLVVEEKGREGTGVWVGSPVAPVRPETKLSLPRWKMEFGISNLNGFSLEEGASCTFSFFEPYPCSLRNSHLRFAGAKVLSEFSIHRKPRGRYQVIQSIGCANHSMAIESE